MDCKLIENVLIIGAGWVGRQVAARLALHQINVWMMDREAVVAQQAVHWIEQQLAESDTPTKQLGPVQVADPLAELSPTSPLVATDEIQLVLECVPEELSLKKRVLRRASQLFRAPTIIASNSSYFVPSLLAPYIEAPKRFAHIHFHVPVLRESVVDIVGCADTEPNVIGRLQDLAERIGQYPLVLRREHPGYVFNWMLQALLRSALELSALDVADRADIDRCWQAVTGMPLGPFGMMDRIGLDVIEQVLANSRWAEPLPVGDADLLKLLQQHTQQGHLGTKSGQGFYQYPDAGCESGGHD